MKHSFYTLNDLLIMSYLLPKLKILNKWQHAHQTILYPKVSFTFVT